MVKNFILKVCIVASHSSRVDAKITPNIVIVIVVIEKSYYYTICTVSGKKVNH